MDYQVNPSTYETITEEERQNFFGYFWDYLKDEDVRDVDYDSGEVWLTFSDGSRKRAEKDERITEVFLDSFTNRARNIISGDFSAAKPYIETEFDSARITMIFENVSVNSRTINIRKVTKKPILTASDMIKNGYASKEVLAFLVNCVKANNIITVSGLTDVGKTELAKFLSTFILPYEKVVTVEDRKEWYFKEFMPDNDCISLIKSDYLNASEAIRLALRLNPDWLMFQEVRGIESNELVTGWSTGIPGISTLHSKDAESDPYRMVNMMGPAAIAGLDEVYEYMDCGIHIKRKKMPDGTKKRVIDQIALYENDFGKNNSILICENGKIVKEELTRDIQRKFDDAGIKDPFESDRLEKRIKDEKRIRGEEKKVG